MKSRKPWLLTVFILFAASVVAFFVGEHGTSAAYKDYLTTLNAGAALIIDADISMDTEELIAYVETVNNTGTNDDDLIRTGLFMTNVKNVLNVREEPSEDSERVGKIYADCGGTILNRQDGWTLIESGNLIGWCSDEYLLFGEEAEKLAEDVGMTMATVTTEGLRVRGEPSTNGILYGILNKDDVMEVIDNYTTGDEWVTVSYDGVTGYVSGEYVEVNRIVDTGETLEEIAEREAEEKAASKERFKDLGSYTSDISDLELLAALIYCEAGNQTDEGKLAVGAVVMNRLNSPSYPDTLRGVIGASGQFSPVASGFLARVLSKNKVPQSCYDAAQKALNGESNVGSATHFRRVGSREGTVIGDHVFW